MKPLTSLSLLMLALLCLNSCAKLSQKKAAEVAAIPYPLDTCMVIGAKLNSRPKTYTRIHQGQEVKFCCKSCIIAFEANPEPYMEKLKK